MTEKQYGGSSPYGIRSNNEKKISPLSMKTQKKENRIEYNMTGENNSDIEKIKNAGNIAKEAVQYAKSLIKSQMLLIEIAEKVESKIIELGGQPAFPVNLSINEIAAHSTPSFNDEQKASGLLKVDLGVNLNGFIADTAFSIDLENSQENKNLIDAAENALKSAIDELSKNEIKIRNIGKAIETEIRKLNLVPIQNLSGHSIEPYELHAGITIPNYDNAQEKVLEDGVYAIEPFTTNGLGAVRDGKPSGIYILTKEAQVRDIFAREVLIFIKENYKTLPFCSRWLYKEFGSRSLIALKRLEEAEIVHQYPQLIEKGGGKVAQAEHTFILSKNKSIITTK